MRRVMIVLCSVCIWASMSFAMSATDLGSGFNVPVLPNLQVGSAYDYATNTRPITLTSTILTKSFLDLRVGYLADSNTSDAWVCGLNLNVKKLVYTIGGQLNYAWDGILDVSAGVWAGYDFSKNRSRYGIGVVLIKAEFK